MKLYKLSLMAVAIAALTACEGDDGRDGTNGTDGSNGLNSLITQTKLSVGDTNCPAGGVAIRSGLDDNADGTLQDNEVDATEYVCAAGANGIAASQLGTSLNNSWFIDSANSVDAATSNWKEAVASASAGKAKNIILFLGDGMGISTVTAARILEGQMKGGSGEEHSLSFGKMPFAALSKTFNVDAQTPDSAGTMTAIVTGVKTDAGVIGVDEDIVRGDCATVAGNELATALEVAEIIGKSTGIVSTARITHATPASTYAKSADRNWEDNSDMPDTASACEDIASQLVNFEANLEARYPGVDVDGIEVVMGGGRRHFLPKDASANSPDASSDVEGDRTDGRNLITEWQGIYPTGTYVYDQAGFNSINAATTSNVFALFNESHMQYEADRKNDIAGEPSIAEMTEKAIDVLSRNDKGYFLTVESGRIDHGHHAGNAYNALHDTIAFSDAIAKAMAMTDPSDTLIIVTADHSHVFTIAGYPKRGNPILGKVVSIGSDTPALASDEMPYTTLGYTNGLGFRDLGNETNADAIYSMDPNAGRFNLTNINTEAPGFHQEALVPRGSETHAGEDVGIYARGPGAHLVNGTLEQNMIFHIMNYAGGLTKAADKIVP